MRKTTRHKMAGSNLLQLFWDLSSLKEKTRVEAATKLLQRLDQSKEVNSELEYCVKRLVSGLASNRKGARQGYFIALCEILSRYSEVTVDHILSLIHDKLECIGNVKAAEERGAYFGQIFALLALIQSKRLTQPENVKSVVQKLAVISKKKINLREFCAVSVTQLLEGVDQEVVQLVIPYLELECGWEKCTPEILLIIISLQSKYGEEVWFQKLITMHWGDVPDILSSDYFKHLSPILLLSSSTHPRIHSVWPFIINQLRRGKDWTVFWSTIIDDCLLTSTYERKFLAYQVIEQLILPTMTANEVGVVLSPTLLQTLKTSTRVSHHVLYEASQHVLDQLIQYTSKNQVLNVGVWLHLLNGNQFKEIAAKLLSQLSVGGVAEYVHLIMDQTQDTHWILQQISMLLKSVPRNLKHSDWLHPLAQHVLVQAYYVTEPQFVTGEIFQEKLVTILTELCNLKLTGKNQSCDIWSVTMLKELEELDSLSLISEMTGEEKEVWQKSVQLILSLKDKEERDDRENVFLYLLSLSTLEMIWDREVAPATTEELLTCYKNMITSLNKTPMRGRRKSKAPPTDPDWIEVLTDILLSLLSRSQQIWRITVKRAFHLMMKYLTPNTMQLFVKALETREVDDLMEAEEKEDTNVDDDMETFHDPSAEFLADVRNVLGDLVHSDQESVSSIDEEDMEALDEALASVFRKRQNEIEAKKQKKADETSVMHFKMRVLDLMEQFIHHQSTNILVLELLQPLFQLVTQLQEHKFLSLLADKANNVLEKLCRVKTYPHEGLDVSSLHSLLEQLITCHLYKAKKLTVPTITQLSMFLIRLLRGTRLPIPEVSPMMTRSSRKRKLTVATTSSKVKYGGLLVDNLTQWCSAALTHMITVKNSNVPMGFFQSYCERQPELGWKLLPTLISSLKSPGNHFKQIQGYTLVTIILHHSNKLEEVTVRSDLNDLASPLQDRCVLDLTSSAVATNKIILECIDLLITILKSHDELIGLVNKDLLLTTFNELMSNQTLPTKTSKQISKLSTQLENEETKKPPKRKKK